eukprot:2335031-Prymnesium_polylepis.2
MRARTSEDRGDGVAARARRPPHRGTHPTTQFQTTPNPGPHAKRRDLTGAPGPHVVSIYIGRSIFEVEVDMRGRSGRWHLGEMPQRRLRNSRRIGTISLAAHDTAYIRL